MEADGKKNSTYTFKVTKLQTSIRQETQALTHWNINRISRQTYTHTFRQACQKGAPLWNRTSWNCQEKHSPSQRAIPVLSNDFAFMTRKKFYPFCSDLEKKKRKKESKIKLRLCGKSIHWSSNDFQLCVITNLGPLQKHPLKRVVPIKCSLLQKKSVYWAIEESTQ